MVLAERPWGAPLRSILRIVSLGVCVMLLSFAITVLLKPEPASGFAAHQGVPQNDRAASAVWDREGAARYLDERMDTWFANAKKLRTGQGDGPWIRSVPVFTVGVHCGRHYRNHS